MNYDTLDLYLGSCSVRISAETPVILAEKKSWFFSVPADKRRVISNSLLTGSLHKRHREATQHARVCGGLDARIQTGYIRSAAVTTSGQRDSEQIGADSLTCPPGADPIRSAD